METADLLRTHLVVLLRMQGAHLTLDEAVAGFPVALRGRKPAGATHTPWQLLEHLRIAQWDILDFCRNPKYQEMQWPDDYWPPTEAPPDGGAWERSVEQFRSDAQELEALISDESLDLFGRVPHGSGQTLLREALLAADHNAYHLGQLVYARKMLEGGAASSR